MKKKRRKQQKSSKKLLLLAILVLTVGIGFASLQKYLSINGTASIDSNFDVSFGQILKVDSSGTAYEKSEPTLTSTTATFNVGLMTPGDSLTYEITVDNYGQMNAKLDSIELNQIGSSNIKFEVLGMSEGDILQPFQTKDVKVKVTYVENNLNETNNEKEASITLLFVQITELSEEQQNEIEEFQLSKSVTVNDYFFTSAGSESAKILFSYGDGPYQPNFSLYNNDEIIYEDGAGKEYTLYFGELYNLKTRDSLIFNGSKVYSQESDVKSFLLDTLEDRFIVNTANDKNEVIALHSAYSSDTLYLEPNVTYRSLFMGSNENDIKTIVIPSTVELSSLSNSSLYKHPQTILKIINQTGQSIDWAPIVGIYNQTYEFETGTCGNVAITNTLD